jgi:superfamily II DNA or RNA helicase
LRPTKSLALYLQQVGRALRPAPGKAKAVVLDHAGNTFRFGLADAPCKWSLQGKAKDEDARAAAPVKRCPACGAINPISAVGCIACGAQLREASPPRSHVEIEGGRLTQVTLSEQLAEMSYWQCIRWAGDVETRLHLVARARGYKRGWIWHRLQAMAEP